MSWCLISYLECLTPKCQFALFFSSVFICLRRKLPFVKSQGFLNTANGLSRLCDAVKVQGTNRVTARAARPFSKATFAFACDWLICNPPLYLLTKGIQLTDAHCAFNYWMKSSMHAQDKLLIPDSIGGCYRVIFCYAEPWEGQCQLRSLTLIKHWRRSTALIT